MRAETKVVGIVGSYRKGGVVDTAMDEVLAACAEQGARVRKIYLIDQHIEFCTNCRHCMQEPGEERGECIHSDDMEGILREIETSQALVIGSPVNFGNLTAVTRKFLERCVGYAYWPWGSPAPKIRNKARGRKVAYVSASAAPAIMRRLNSGVTGGFKELAKILGAKSVGIVWVGLVNKENMVLSNKQKAWAKLLGKRLLS